MPARPTVSEPRRDEIMTAAKKVFARNGFDGTTIADVAKEAGLPFDVVYQYFDSKDALFLALIAAQEYALRTHIAVALAASGASFGYTEVPFRATLRGIYHPRIEYPAPTKAELAKAAVGAGVAAGRERRTERRAAADDGEAAGRSLSDAGIGGTRAHAVHAASADAGRRNLAGAEGPAAGAQ